MQLSNIGLAKELVKEEDWSDTTARQYVSEPLEYVVDFRCLMKRGRRTARWDYLHAFPTSPIPVERDF